jgi:hypothetical protein
MRERKEAKKGRNINCFKGSNRWLWLYHFQTTNKTWERSLYFTPSFFGFFNHGFFSHYHQSIANSPTAIDFCEFGEDFTNE